MHLLRILRQVAERSSGKVGAVDMSPLSAAGQLASNFTLVPPTSDPNFVPRLVALCEELQIDYLVPTIDPELPILAAHRDEFQRAGVEVWVSSPSVVELSEDKWRFAEWLTEHGFDLPATSEARNARPEDFVGPVIAKPRNGSSSVGIVQAERLTSDILQTLRADYIVQEKVEGYEVTVDFAVDAEGRLLGVSMRRRLEVRDGEVVKAVTLEHPQLLDTVERFALQLIGAFGVLNVQVFVDDVRNSIKFLELNARFGGGYPLSWMAGATFPEQLVEGSRDRRDARPGLVMLRFDDAVFGEAAELGLSL